MVLDISSQITFLYYQDLVEAENFFSDVMNLRLAQDEGWAKVYQINDTSFIGVVDENKGIVRTKGENAVVVTLCVENVDKWYSHLLKKDVKILKEVAECKDLQLKNFFVKGPGNYMFEFLQYLSPNARKVFHKQK